MRYSDYADLKEKEINNRFSFWIRQKQLMRVGRRKKFNRICINEITTDYSKKRF